MQRDAVVFELYSSSFCGACQQTRRVLDEVARGLFLGADEIPDGDDVPIREHRLAHFEGREGRGPPLVVGGRGDPDPVGFGLLPGEVAHGLQVFRRLLDADLRLVGLGAYPGGVVPAEEAEESSAAIPTIRLTPTQTIPLVKSYQVLTV